MQKGAQTAVNCSNTTKYLGSPRGSSATSTAFHASLAATQLLNNFTTNTEFA